MGGGKPQQPQRRVARLKIYVPNPNPRAAKMLTVMSIDIYSAKDVSEIVRQILPTVSRNCIAVKMELLQSSKRVDAELIRVLRQAVIQVEP